MNPVQIKTEIAARGLTQAKIARELNVRADMISQMVNGFNYYPSIAEQIREKWGISIPRPESRRISGVESKPVIA